MLALTVNESILLVLQLLLTNFLVNLLLFTLLVTLLLFTLVFVRFIKYVSFEPPQVFLMFVRFVKYVSFEPPQVYISFVLNCESIARHLQDELVKGGINCSSTRSLPDVDYDKYYKKAIKGCKIFIPIFSKGYASDVRCLTELTYMVKSQTYEGQSRIIPLFYDVKSSEVRQQKGDYEAAFRHHELSGQRNVQQWKDVLRMVGQMKGFEENNISDNAQVPQSQTRRFSFKSGPLIPSPTPISSFKSGPPPMLTSTPTSGSIPQQSSQILSPTSLSGSIPQRYSFMRSPPIVSPSLKSMSEQSSPILPPTVKSIPQQSSPILLQTLRLDLIKSVAEKVLFELKNIDVRKKWVGIDSHVAKMEKLLNVQSNNVRVVVIHGIGGIGKTTIAKIIYDKIAQSFECCCFLDDVRVKSKDYNGLVNLQMQLISKTGNVQSTKIADAGEGIEKIKKTVCGKKSLIVLDDVDEKRQFDMLTGKYNWYGAGSKIIVTTRNSDFVQMLELMYKRDGLLDVCRSYEPPLMNRALSLKLFSKHAFFKDTPLKNYKTLSKKVVSSAGGLPLVLVTMGSLLAGERDKHLWEEKSRKLDKVPHKEVSEKLRISYEGLSYEQQQVFLDIACFFLGEDKGNPSYMWNACAFNQREAIKTLVCRSMVKVGDDNSLWMHDHLRDLGRQIVREENSSEPWKRSRLWRHEEAFHLLVGCKGTRNVTALHLDFVRGEQMSCSNCLVGKYFENLQNLRFLRMGSVDLDGNFKHVFQNLIWLKWAPLGNFSPTNCNLNNLTVLDLSYSQITDDWNGWSEIKMAKLLKVLNLSYCYSLTTASHFSMFATLEQLILSSCFGLVKVDPTIGNIMTLNALDLSNCLVLRGTLDCSKFFPSLKSLDVSSTRLCDLPGLGELNALTNLNTSGCRSLSRLSDLSNLKMLRKLDTSGCVALTEIQSLEELEYLEHLDTSGCISLGRLPDFSTLGMLQEVNIAKCDKLLEVESLSCLEYLVTLNMSWCASLKSLPNLSKLKHLKKLRIAGFEDLKEIMGIEEVKSLELLDICGWKSIEKLPTMSNLTQLKEIYASRCVKLIDVSGLAKLGSLEFLDISGCISIKNLPNLSKLKRLKVIKVSGCLKLSEIQGLEKLRSLALLDISGCKSLKNQPYLPNTRIEELY